MGFSAMTRQQLESQKAPFPSQLSPPLLPSLSFHPGRPQGESCLPHVEPEILVWPVAAGLASERVPEPQTVTVRA